MLKTKRRGLILTAIAIFLAFLVALLLFSYLNRLEREVGKKTRVVVAAKDIPARTVITEDMLSYDKIPTKYVRDSYLGNIQEATGQFPLIDINKNDILQRNKLGTGMQLEPGMRAVTIGVNEVTGVGGLLSPGDRVDVIVSYEVKGSSAKKTEMLWQNKEVLAVGTATAPELRLGPISTEALLPGEMPSAVANTVTLALTPEDTVKLTYMSNFGKEVRLVLRSKADKKELPVPPVTSEDFR